MNSWACIAIIVTIVSVYCEFLADYTQLLQCSSWPKFNSDGGDDVEKTLHAMVLADTHMLGPVRGHWLDKIYREWHMHRAFQAAITLFRPEIVFILGDIFDEGDFVNHSQFRDYVHRFRHLFRTPPGIPVISAVGNHDVGFHYKMHPFFTERFEEQFNNTGARLYTFKGGSVHFVLVNSMALENDGCYFCESTLRDLNEISSKLDCLKNTQTCNDTNTLLEHRHYSRPILMQHFPTYRVSDKICTEHDAPEIQNYRENWDVLSKESTDILGKLLNPRVAFAGHSHHYCLSINRLGIKEYTVSSFNWRNKVNPSFLLASFTDSKYAISKCNMLEQRHVYSVYVAAILICSSITIFQIYRKLFGRKTLKVT